MKIFRIVIGILFIISGIYAMLTPGATFLSLAWVIGIMLMVSGITHIISYIADRKDNEHTIWYLINGIFSLLIGIIVISNGLLYFVTEFILIYIFAGWITVSGLIQFRVAFLQKKQEQKWILIFITAIITIIIGITSFFNPVLLALSIGILIGVWMMIAGINLITFSSSIKKLEK